jgi:hypothetical protein
MRRVRASVIAAGYALSFIVVCLGACLASGPAADHGCCAGAEGLRAPVLDCCSVVPGVGQPSAAVAGDGSASSLEPRPLLASPAFLPAASAPTLAPSPPLVLRI